MKKRRIQIREYSSSTLGKLTTSTENALFDIADMLSSHYRSQVLKCSKNRSGEVIITTSSFVGVIDVDDILTIEIIPKIYDADDNASLQNLFYMLSYCGKFTIPNNRITTLDKYDGSFFEVLIGMFAEELLDKVQNSAHHEYVIEESNRQYLRGKLLMSDHLKVNGMVANKFFTQTDEFTADTVLNQTLKFVSVGLYKLTINPASKKRLRQCIDLFDEVADVRIMRTQAERIHINRLNKRFENLLTLAKLFLNNQTLVARSGLHDSWTILFDMNVLFEEFIAKALQNGLSDSQYIVVSQGPRDKFARNVEDDRTVFATKPDISIVQNKTVLKIADTKYKKLTEDDTKYGVSQSDLYQMFAYSRRYETNDITLIYPKTNQVTSHTLELPDETRVYIRTINLERNICEEIRTIEQEVVSIFKDRHPTGSRLYD
jgi:5-methylcytosine-specific restriction enzyme subunit McrC